MLLPPGRPGLVLGPCWTLESYPMDSCTSCIQTPGRAAFDPAVVPAWPLRLLEEGHAHSIALGTYTVGRVSQPSRPGLRLWLFVETGGLSSLLLGHRNMLRLLWLVVLVMLVMLVLVLVLVLVLLVLVLL